MSAEQVMLHEAERVHARNSEAEEPHDVPLHPFWCGAISL